MLSRRFAMPPVKECAYEPREVPNAARDMRGTVLVRPSREEWQLLLGEMVQMTNEAVRRRGGTSRDDSKPLMLEYMADRIDVDDPLFGYLAVTKEEGWAQGFVTVTTFTTWHENFRWDSRHPCLEMRQQRAAAEEDAGGSSADSAATASRPPAIDEDGTLADELMTEVRGWHASLIARE